MTGQLYCFFNSGHSYKVASYLTCAGIDWEPVWVDYFNGHTRTEHYRNEINSMGEAPVWIHGKTQLTQSGAILIHLSRQTGLYAPHKENQDEVFRWLLWDNHKLSAQMGVYRYLCHFVPKEKQSADILTMFERNVHRAYLTLDKQLESHQWVAGEQPSIADFSCAGYFFYQWDGFHRQEWPHIDRWMSQLENLPGWSLPEHILPKQPSDVTNIIDYLKQDKAA